MNPAELQERLLAVYQRAAETGGPCPTYSELRKQLGAHRMNLTAATRQLERAGALQIEVRALRYRRVCVGECWSAWSKRWEDLGKDGPTEGRDLCDVLLDIYRAAANSGEPCPSYELLARQISTSRGSAHYMTVALEKRGAIKMDTTAGAMRRVGVDGKWTDWSRHLRPEHLALIEKRTARVIQAPRHRCLGHGLLSEACRGKADGGPESWFCDHCRVVKAKLDDGWALGSSGGRTGVLRAA